MIKSNAGGFNKNKRKDREKQTLLIMSIIGIIIFSIYISVKPQYTYKHIKDLKYADIGKKVTICGYVNKTITKENALFFILSEGNSSIQSVYFKPNKKDIKENQIVCVKGETKMYKGKIELISHEISHEVN